jgi:pimeloyl-ACP methyl ester carboxylesterase
LLRHHYRTNPQQQQQQSQRHNPYSIEAHAHLTLRFCAALGLRRVVLVGHADGCLVVVHAAAAACRAARYMQQLQQQQRRSFER